MESIAGMMQRPLSAVVVGSGNVATRLVPALEEAGVIDVAAVVSRTYENAARLAGNLKNAQPLALGPSLTKLPKGQVYILAVSDDALAQLACTLAPDPDGLWIHTSGGVDASVLAPLSSRYGVLYPLQTLSREKETDLTHIPLFTEASDDRTLAMVDGMAIGITDNLRHANSEMRRRLHAAAVFACNFVNHMWAIADDILHRHTDADITVLAPLLRETLDKALAMPPRLAQTGPARRGDNVVMQRHIALLEPWQAQLYEVLSHSIINYYEQN